MTNKDWIDSLREAFNQHTGADTNPNSTRQQKNSELNTRIALLSVVTANTAKNTSDGINYDKREAMGHLDGVFMNQLGKKTGLRLQPAFVEWMQGFPIGWTELSPSETQLYRKSRQKSSRQLNPQTKPLTKEANDPT